MENQLKNERLANLEKLVAKVGVTPDFLKKDLGKNYTVGEAMVSGERSPLTQLKMTQNEVTAQINGKLRVSYESAQDRQGRLSVIGVQKELHIPKNIQNFNITEEMAQSLKQSGHLGQLANINGKDSFLSVDKDTNTLVTTSLNKVNIPEKILGQSLNKEQQNTLKNGGAISLENMINKQGETFSARIQVDAGKRGLEFRAIHAPEQKQEKKLEQTQQQAKPKLKPTPKTLAEVAANKTHKAGLSL